MGSIGLDCGEPARPPMSVADSSPDATRGRRWPCAAGQLRLRRSRSGGRRRTRLTRLSRTALTC